ncbi:MAG: hypothetical protein KY434_04795 [Actinobacteria bacterium]|nr:hypothetical protein [Actinomycetota bacterium]
MLVWFPATPIGTGSASVAEEVARAVEAAEATGVRAAAEAVLTTAPHVTAPP